MTLSDPLTTWSGPLGLNRDLNCALAVEYYAGEQLSHAIHRSIHCGDDAQLFWRRKALAYFLATLHNRTANGATVDFDADCRYLEYFDPIIVSGDYGYRKPDERLFRAALDGMAVAPEQTLYVRNDMHRDIYGAREVGMKTVMFDSDQGAKEYQGCVPDFTITDHRELLGIWSSVGKIRTR